MPPLQQIAIIPARKNSTRLPHKALADLGGEPLIWRVVEAARRCPDLQEIWVATDDAEIAEAVRRRGGQALRVDAPCDSGTVRVALAVEALGAHLAPDAIVLNVQGDEPFTRAETLSALVGAIQGGAPIATAAAPLPADALADRHAVKVVRDMHDRALYFSRAPIPGDLHLGLYAFRRAVLQEIAPQPRAPLAQQEDLEQLSWLVRGWPIRVVAAPPCEPGVDTPADLERARRHWAAHHRAPSPLHTA